MRVIYVGDLDDSVILLQSEEELAGFYDHHAVDGSQHRYPYVFVAMDEEGITAAWGCAILATDEEASPISVIG